MATLYLKQTDLGPKVETQLCDPDGNPIDLTGKTIQFQMKRVGRVSLTVDDTGVEGLERMYNEWLTGTPGSRKIRRDAKGRQVEILETTSGEKAGDLQLTIDNVFKLLLTKR